MADRAKKMGGGGPTPGDKADRRIMELYPEAWEEFFTGNEHLRVHKAVDFDQKIIALSTTLQAVVQDILTLKHAVKQQHEEIRKWLESQAGETKGRGQLRGKKKARESVSSSSRHTVSKGS